jgi:nitrous oxidase accessory protein NosD
MVVGLKLVSRVGWIAALGAVALLAASGSAVADATLSCGETITADVTLQANIGGCSGDGLLVAGDGVTVDLNGHTISGSGNGTGVTVTGAHVTIQNGLVRGFLVGVRSFGSSGGGDYTRIWRVKVTANDTGILAFSNFGTIEDSKISANAHDGISGGGGSGWTIRDSEISDNGRAGVVLFSALDSMVVRNSITGNSGNGIDFRFSVDRALIADNVVARNDGFGIRVIDSTTQVLRNSARSNGDTGIYLSEGANPSAVQFYLIAENVSNKNGGFGISATLGMIDGGGNVAKDNALTPECINVVCSKK